MGVKDLWGLVSPLGEVLPLTALQGTAVAIDLAPWVVDSQNVNMGRVTRPHLRNLLWRTLRLLNAGVVPLFVLEGDAPSLKWNTISKRNQQNFAHGREASATTVKTGKRSQFKTVQKECAHLLDLLGVPWVQAIGEAEATCAALNYHQVVSGVITQDSDVFLYGGETVFRNFSANQSKATVERFKMSSIEEHLGVNRSGLLVLALLLGCDYLPAGVPKVGKETAIRMIREWYQKGVSDPLDRICHWSLEDDDDWKDINPKKWKTGSLLELEAGVRLRALATDGFPFMDIIKEYKSKIRIPFKSCKWKQPQMQELLSWCIIKLDWEPDYTMDKIAPVVSRWIMMNISPQKPLPANYVPEMQAVRCIKKCVRGGVSSMVVEWHVINNEKYKCSIPAYVNTDEPVTFINEAAPHLIEQFEAELAAKKKETRSRKKKNEEKSDNGVTSINLNANAEAKKSSRKKPVKSEPKIKPITNYMKPKSIKEDVTKKQTEELKIASSYIENVQNQNCLPSLQDKAMSRPIYELTKKENHSIGTNITSVNNSFPKKIKNSSDAESFNEIYDMPSMNDDELAELSGMLHKLEMADKQEIMKDLNRKFEQSTVKSKIGKEDSFKNDDFNESCNIDNLSEIISRISEPSFSEEDKNIALCVNGKQKQINDSLDYKSCAINLPKSKSCINNNNNNIDAEKNSVQEISRPIKEHKKPLYKENCTLKEKNYSEESIIKASSGNINETNISLEESNYDEKSWEEDDDDFELSMIINRITGMKMVNTENACVSKSAVVNKSLNAHQIRDDKCYLSDEDKKSSKSEIKTKVTNDKVLELKPETLENLEENEHSLKNSTCWNYFAPISERQNITDSKPLDATLGTEAKNESNLLCNKENPLLASLKHEKYNMVTAQTIASNIIKSSLKDSCELSTFGNTMSDSILAEVAECISASKKENLKSQTSFDLFENSTHSNTDQGDKKLLNLKSEKDRKKRITPNLPKYHSTPSVGCIPPRRILNCERINHTPNFLYIKPGNDLVLPSPFSVSSPAQTSFVSDIGTPSTTLSPSKVDLISDGAMYHDKEKQDSNFRNGKTSKGLPHTKNKIDTPVSSKLISNKVCNSAPSETLFNDNQYHNDIFKYQHETDKIPNYKVKEENKLCFKLLDSFDNSDGQQIVDIVPKLTSTDCDSISRQIPKEFSRKKNSQLNPKENISSRNDKDKRKPLKELMDIDGNIELFQNKMQKQKEEISRQKDNYNLQDKKMHNKNREENIENSNIPEKIIGSNLGSKYSDYSPYSPVVPSQYVSLADRLKAKYRDKAMEKLIDQL